MARCVIFRGSGVRPRIPRKATLASARSVIGPRPLASVRDSCPRHLEGAASEARSFTSRYPRFSIVSWVRIAAISAFDGTHTQGARSGFTSMTKNESLFLS